MFGLWVEINTCHGGQLPVGRADLEGNCITAGINRNTKQDLIRQHFWTFQSSRGSVIITYTDAKQIRLVPVPSLHQQARRVQAVCRLGAGNGQSLLPCPGTGSHKAGSNARYRSHSRHMNCTMSWEQQQQQVKAVALSYEVMKTKPPESNLGFRSFKFSNSQTSFQYYATSWPSLLWFYN